jgi:hypothetical protein
MSNRKLIASILALLLLPALAGCEDPREYDLTLDPFIYLEEATWEYVRISWDAYEDARELKFERRLRGSDDPWEVLSILPPTVQEYTDDTVDPGLTYRYRLRGVYDTYSHLSVVLDVEVPEEPEPAPLVIAAPPAGLVSPDGTRSARIFDDRVWITELITGVASPATRFELGPESGVAWMPDSRRILLVAGPEGARHLYLYDPDDRESRVLARNAADPAVSKDGRTVSFVVAGVTHTILLEDWGEGS